MLALILWRSDILSTCWATNVIGDAGAAEAQACVAYVTLHPRECGVYPRLQFSWSVLTDCHESMCKPNNAKAPLLTRRLLKLHTHVRKRCPWFNFCCEFVGRVTGIDDLSKQWSEWTSAALQMMKDFSGLALPPLFGEHILEAELEPGGVELGPGEVTLKSHVCQGVFSSAAKSLKHRI